MKPQKVAISCDSNPYYLEFWEPVSRMWKHKIGIEPYLFYVGSKDTAPPNHHGTVVQVDPVDGVPIHTQAQWARFHFTQTDLDSTWITSDIDMFPLSTMYFIDMVKPFANDCFVGLNTDMKNYFPVCYNMTTGYMFKKVLELKDTFSECVKTVYASSRTDSHIVNNSLMENWSCDERYSSYMICRYRASNPTKVIQLLRPDGYHNGRRINRTNWEYNEDRVKRGWYIDCHSLRPYSQNKEQIETLLSTALA